MLPSWSAGYTFAPIVWKVGLTVTFEAWTEHRSVAFMGTNAGAGALPFQTWHHFKEAFTPELVAKAVKENNIEVRRCLDPFGGSGTTALSCQFLGITPVTIEVNPFLADLIESKLVSYDPDILINDVSLVLRYADRLTDENDEYLDRLPPTFVEPGLKGRWLFDRTVARRIARLLRAIERLESYENRRLLKVLLGGTLVGLSNAVVNGKGRRYRRGWEGRHRSAEDVDSAFAEAAYGAALEINRHQPRRSSEYQIIRGDSRVALELVDTVDLAIFSPPYPNSFDYTDIYNIELWMLGYLMTSEDNRLLRSETLCSHVQLARSYPTAPAGSQRLLNTLAQLETVKRELWSHWIPQMIGGYFAEMLTILKAIRAKLRLGGSAWLVIGDSRYAGVTIETGLILRDLAETAGFSVLSCESSREMRASAQQGGRRELAETLLVLETRPNGFAAG